MRYAHPAYKTLPVQYIAGIHRPEKRSASGNVLTRKAIKEEDEEGRNVESVIKKTPLRRSTIIPE